MFEWLPSLFYGLTASDWINLVGLFSTPAICIWFFPNLRALAVGVVITSGFWVFGAVRTGQDLPFVLGSTAVVAAVCALTCGAVLFVRRLMPHVRDPSGINDEDSANGGAGSTAERRPDPLRPWTQAIAIGLAAVIVALALWKALASPS